MKYHLDRKNQKIYFMDPETNEILFFNTGRMGEVVLGESEKAFVYMFSNISKYAQKMYGKGYLEGAEWHEVPKEIKIPIVSARLDDVTTVAYLRLMYQYHNTSALIRDAINALMDKALEEDIE